MPHTLLLADDSVTIQRVIELTFADEDVQVVAVSDGDQAIERLEASPPDIVLADVGMPGKNGYEVAQYMKRSPRLAHIPVLLLTGAFEPVDQARVAEAGCDGVLVKPFEPNLVIDRVRELLSRPRQPGAPAAPPSQPASDHWSPPPVAAQAPPAPRVDASRPAPARPVADLDDYFDRLDAAFTDRAPAPDFPTLAPAPPAVADEAVAEEIDWFGAADASASDLPLATTPPSPPAPPEPVVPPPVATAPEPPRSAPVPPSAASTSKPSAPPPLPSLADAFAALLAAEQNEPVPPHAAVWPASSASPAVVGDDVVEEVTRRVLDRLSDRVIRDTVSDVVSSIAERLVRDEIDRIKASIK